MQRLYIKQWREARGLTQEEAAMRAHVRQATWSFFERGITTPHRATIVAVARALRVKPMALVRRPPKEVTKR